MEMEELAEDILHNSNSDEQALKDRKVMLKEELANVPEHQLHIMNTFPNYPANNFPYKPDPETGYSKWPLQGMQGSFTPLRSSPFAESSSAQDWKTMKNDMFDPKVHGKSKPSESMEEFCSSRGQSWTVTSIAQQLR